MKGSKQLSKAQQDVLYLLTKEFLTINKIAIRRGTSNKAVYKIIKRLKKKGIVSNLEQGVEKNLCGFQPFKKVSINNTPTFPVEHQIRLHSQEFNIRILYKDQKYKNLLSKAKLNKANTIYIDGNTIRLFKNTIEVYSGHSFYADDVKTATADSFIYWNRLFSILENDLKVILIKSRSQNIKLVKHHYAEINNEFAKDCEVKADKIKVYTTDDNKIWFLIDNSFNLHEAETIHPTTARQDMDIIKPFFNDLRDKKPPLLSEVWQVLGTLANQPNIYTNSINALTKQINLHLEVMQNIGNGVNKWNKSIDKLNETIKNTKKPAVNTPKRPKNKHKDVIDQLFANPVKLAKFKLLSKDKQNKILFGGKE